MTDSGSVQPLDTVQERLNRLHDSCGLSWRKIAALEEYRGIPAGTLCAIAKGREPKKRSYRAKLGLPPLYERVEVCPIHGEAHTYDCQAEVVKPKPAPRPKRKRTPYFKCRPDDIEQTMKQLDKYYPGEFERTK